MAKTPHFFKIILQDAVQQGKLGVPKKFARRYGNYLSEKAFLKVPTGAKWEVELVKSGDNIWFGNGWQRFVDYYSLSLESFLVFGFEDFKICTFSVLIFDKTTSEIKYPVHIRQDNEEPNLEEQVHQPINDEHINMDAYPLPFSGPREKRKQEINIRTQSEAKRARLMLTAKENADALNRARASYKSENPSFSIVMQPTYVSDKKEKVTIPGFFAKEYFKKDRGGIILESVEGKTWSVEYASYRIHKTARLTMMANSWRKFAEENHLEIGDVCVFELMNHNALKLKVVICRKNHEFAQWQYVRIGAPKRQCFRLMTNCIP